MMRPVASDLHATVARRLRTVNQRYTAQRESLVTALERAVGTFSQPHISHATCAELAF